MWFPIACCVGAIRRFAAPTGVCHVCGLCGWAAIVAVVLEHISATSAVLTVAIALYFAAIEFLFVWVILTGRRLYQLGSPDAGAQPKVKLASSGW